MASEIEYSDNLTERIGQAAERARRPNGPATEPAPAVEAPVAEPEPKSPTGRLAQVVANLRKRPELSREAKSGERTRGLVVLAGATIACVFLFFGLFTTDTSTNRTAPKMAPSLGRPKAATVNPETANRSVVPQLSATQGPEDETGGLTEKDVLGTMKRNGNADRSAVPPVAPPSAPPKTPAAPRAHPTLAAVNFQDPALAEAYRRQGIAPPPPSTQVNSWAAETGHHETAAMPGQSQAVVLAANRNDSLRQSSIVFARSGAAQSHVAPTLMPLPRTTGLLLQGAALIARLQHTVSSAAKVPVIAVIEYNYEKDGELIVPAGAKAYGELAQATPQGWVSIAFHTLELPNGQREAINGSAISMERGVLRGDVNGKNGAKRFLTRTFTGVGTIAAYAVGGRGLSGNLDNSVLLRERLASNIALGGEQELASMAYQQNIVVTVPANTRFYLVLQDAGISGRGPVGGAEAPASRPTAGAVQEAAGRNSMSEQESREMVELRNELREMNRLMQFSAPKLESPASDNK